MSNLLRNSALMFFFIISIPLYSQVFISSVVADNTDSEPDDGGDFPTDLEGANTSFVSVEITNFSGNTDMCIYCDSVDDMFPNEWGGHSLEFEITNDGEFVIYGYIKDLDLPNCETENHTIYTAQGSDTTPGHVFQDYFILKLDSNGNCMWINFIPAYVHTMSKLADSGNNNFNYYFDLVDEGILMYMNKNQYRNYSILDNVIPRGTNFIGLMDYNGTWSWVIVEPDEPDIYFENKSIKYFNPNTIDTTTGIELDRNISSYISPSYISPSHRNDGIYMYVNNELCALPFDENNLNWYNSYIIEMQEKVKEPYLFKMTCFNALMEINWTFTEIISLDLPYKNGGISHWHGLDYAFHNGTLFRLSTSYSKGGHSYSLTNFSISEIIPLEEAVERGLKNKDVNYCSNQPTEVEIYDRSCNWNEKDDDDDGWNNSDESQCISDINNPSSFPMDTDNDGLCDTMDTINNDEENSGLTENTNNILLILVSLLIPALLLISSSNFNSYTATKIEKVTKNQVNSSTIRSIHFKNWDSIKQEQAKDFGDGIIAIISTSIYGSIIASGYLLMFALYGIMYLIAAYLIVAGIILLFTAGAVGLICFLPFLILIPLFG